MNARHNARTDLATAQVVSQAMEVLAEAGCQRARTFMIESGLKSEFAERMLLMSYDRRRPTKSLCESEC